MTKKNESQNIVNVQIRNSTTSSSSSYLINSHEKNVPYILSVMLGSLEPQTLLLTWKEKKSCFWIFLEFFFITKIVRSNNDVLN